MLAFVTVNKGAGRPDFQQFALQTPSSLLTLFLNNSFIFVVSTLIDLLGGNGQFFEPLQSGETT